MRYHHEKPDLYVSRYGRTYSCEHPVYSRCTLYEMDEKGLAVIQQRFSQRRKTTWWSEIDPWLTDAIYMHPGFQKLFRLRAAPATDGIFPTMTIRQLMWALKMKPIPNIGKQCLTEKTSEREMSNPFYEGGVSI